MQLGEITIRHRRESHDNTVRVWDAERRAELAVFDGHRPFVKFAMTPDGSAVVATDSFNDGRTLVWRVNWLVGCNNPACLFAD